VTGTLESALYVEDLGLTIAMEYPHHVKAHCLEDSGRPMEEVLPSQGADGDLFAGGEGLEWMSETGPST
jgi:hypothetical protein